MNTNINYSLLILFYQHFIFEEINWCITVLWNVSQYFSVRMSDCIFLNPVLYSYPDQVQDKPSTIRRIMTRHTRLFRRRNWLSTYLLCTPIPAYILLTLVTFIWFKLSSPYPSPKMTSNHWALCVLGWVY